MAIIQWTGWLEHRRGRSFVGNFFSNKNVFGYFLLRLILWSAQDNDATD
jgi:hypothetical protein